MRVAAITLIISLTATPCIGMEISRIAGCDGGDVLKLRGDIKPGDYVKFRAHFDGERRIAGLVLDSPGGMLHEGVRIAMLTRQKRLSTFVPKGCDSACAFIFLLGSKRYVAKDAMIGVHAVGNNYGAEDTGTLRDTIYFARLSAKLGIPSSTIGKMVATPPGKIAILDHADLAALKVVVRDPFTRTDESNPDCKSDPPEQASASGGAAIATMKTSNKPESRSGKRAGPARPVDRFEEARRLSPAHPERRRLP